MSKDVFEALDQLNNIVKDFKNNNTGGIEDIPIDEQWQRGCTHPQHQPPSHICIPQGKQLRHVCPGCQHETVIRPLQIRY